MKRELITATAGAVLALAALAGDAPADATGAASGIVRDVRVVDLSGGKYAVSDYADVDTGRFNCDAYKKGKLALVKVPAGAAYPVKPGKYKEPLDDTDVMAVQRDYWIGLFEVTESQYVRVMGEAPTNSTVAKGEVSYTDVRGTGDPTLEMTDKGVGDCFLRRLCEKCVDADGNPVDGFDLPTEVQWEIACRAGTKSVYNWGDSLNDFEDYAWCSDNANALRPVGCLKPNAWGLYDTCGNAYEWCRDTSGKDPQITAEDPASGDDRVIPSWAVRGGSYLLAASYACLESSRRGLGRSAMRAQSDGGFRVVCTARHPFDATGAASGATNDVMVVDLSAGTNAAAYPVSRLRSVDVGRFDCGVYQTNKLVLIRASNGLWTGVRPVTQGQYARVMGGSAAEPADRQGQVSYETLRGTALGAAWPEIRATDLGSFFATLGVKTGLGFDLPSDAEWTAGRDAGMTMPDAGWGEWLLGPKKSDDSAANVGFRVVLNETNAAIVVDGVWQVQADEKVGEREYEDRGLFRFSKLSEALEKINELPPGYLKTLMPSPTLYANRPIVAAKGASFGYDCAFVISNSNTIVDFSTVGNGCLALSGAMPGDDCQIRVASGTKDVEIRNVEFGEFDGVAGEWKPVPACSYAVVAEPGGEVKLAYCQVTHGQMVRAFGKPADREGTLLNLFGSTLTVTNDINPCVVSVSNATLIVNRSTVAAPYDLKDKSRQPDGVRAIDVRNAIVAVENDAVVVGGARTAVGGSGTGIWLEGGSLTLLVATVGERTNEEADLLGWNGIHVERGTLDIIEWTDVFVGVGNNALSFGDEVRAGDVRLADGLFYGGHAVDPDMTATGILDAGDAAARFGRVGAQANDIKWSSCASNVVPFCHYNFKTPGQTPKENEYRPYGVVALADDDCIAEAGSGTLSADGRTLTVQCSIDDFAKGDMSLDLSVLAPEGIDGWNANSDEAWSGRKIVYVAKDAGGSVTTNSIGAKTALAGPAAADEKYGVQPNGYCRVTLPWHPTASSNELSACALAGTALVRELTVFWDGKAPGAGGRSNVYRVIWAVPHVEPSPHAGTADDPWGIGATTNDTVAAWTNGTGLVITGRGAMKDFTDAAPWGTAVTVAEIGAQVTSVGANAFAGCAALGTLVMGGNPPALGRGNDLSDVTEVVVREDALAKFGADPVWRGLEAKFEAVPVCYDWQNVKKLAPFLHEVWYSDYAFDAAGETLSKDAVFACSSVRNGNFIGRNLDFFLNDTPEFVVHVAADPSKGRLASVGMAMHSGMREDGVTNGQYTAAYDLVPNRTVDGINECGVAINQNVVAYDPEVAAGPGQEFHGTNPDGEDLNISFVTRFVLDHATNAAHAVELIRSRNLVGISVSGDLLHYMVSDPDETYVVEIVTNTVVARHMKVMTNFCLNWDNGNARAVTDADTNGCWTAEWYPEPGNLAADKGSMPAITNAIAQVYAKHAEGVERFVRLRDNYAEGETFEGMANLLKRVMYSQAATLETQPYWYSDRTSVAVDELLKGAGYPDAANIRMLYALKYAGNLKLDELLDENLMADERTYLADKDRYRKADTGVWLTVHNTTYDIERRMFRVAVQEDCEHTFDIWLAEPQDERRTWPEDAGFSAATANAYDGFALDASGSLVGLVQVKTAKQTVKRGVTNVTATATVTDAGGKKWSYSKGAVTSDGVVTGLKCTAKGCPVAEFGVTLGRNGMEGAWGENKVFGSRNGMGVRGDAMIEMLEDYKGKWSVTLDGETTVRLQLNVQAKGAVKVAGNWESGKKVSVSAQLVMGDGFAYVPVMVKETRTTPALAALLRIDGERVSLVGGGKLIAGGRTCGDLGEPAYLPSEVPKGGEAFLARVAIDERAYPAKFSAKGLPSGLKINAATGVISGTPTKPGFYVATVTVTSGADSKVKKAITVEMEVGNYTDEDIPIEDSYGPYYVGVAVKVAVPEAGGCKASGLPSGLKWVADEVVGVPTKVCSNTVYFTKSVKKGGKSVKHQASATFRVEGMKPWAVGTFNGGGTNGMVQLTVSKVGKISGKWMSEGTNWTLSAASFDAYDAASAAYHATLTAKSGRASFATEIVVTEGGISGEIFEAWRNGWKESPLREVAKGIKGKKWTGAPEAGTIGFTVGANGTVTAKGTFTGLDGKPYTASCSTVLIPDGEDGYSVYVYYPPKARKFGGFAGRFDGIQL